MRNTCQSAVHTQKTISYWILSVSMATSVLQLCSVKTVLPALLRLLVSHKDAEGNKSFCPRQNALYFTYRLFASPAQQLDNSDSK